MNESTRLLLESEASQRVKKILNGAPMVDDLTPGELFILSKTMPNERIKELVHMDKMPFYGLENLLQREDFLTVEEIDHLIQKMKITAIGFAQKLNAWETDDNSTEEEFYEILTHAKTMDNCMLLMENVSNQKQVDIIVAKIHTFNPTIDDWMTIIEDAGAMAPADHAVTLTALEEMEKIVQNTPTFENWCKLYYASPDNTNLEKKALEEINKFTESFKTWMKISNEYSDSKLGQLARQKMQEMEGHGREWKELFEELWYDYDCRKLGNYSDKSRINLFFQMMVERCDVDELSEISYALEEHDPVSGVIVLRKMVSIINK